MAVKPENSFISSVHKYLPSVELMHREKMNNPYSSGTADWWYSGIENDLWVEYKYLPKLPASETTLILPELTPLQADWLNGRYLEGRNVSVVLGSPEGAVVYEHLGWLNPINRSEFLHLCVTKQQLAELLQLFTIGRYIANKNSTARSTRGRHYA